MDTHLETSGATAGGPGPQFEKHRCCTEGVGKRQERSQPLREDG